MRFEMIGIICAMEIEARRLLEKMQSPVSEKISGVKFIVGKLCGTECVVAVCGVGKVFAAICSQTMLMRYSPELIVNVGVGGTLSERLHCGDIAIASSVVQYDLDTSALGDPRGLVSGINKINFVCDPQSTQLLKALVDERLSVHSRLGVVACGDRFVNSGTEKAEINRWFGALTCDMESGAIGQTCFVNGVPFCVIRSVSDEADGRSHMAYSEFCELAADNAAKLMLAFLAEKSGNAD